MKVALLVAALVGVAFAVPVDPGLDSRLDEHWSLFKQTHQKVYESDQVEAYRRAVFESHVDFIAKHNREADMGMHTYTVGLNEYADMTNEEFVSVMNGYRMRQGPSNATNVFMAPSHVGDVPDMVDWRKEGYVTKVKNQGQCGSCWAFSTTGSLEGQTFKKTKMLVSLSEQNLVDCSKPEGNKGCQGGLMDNGFTYIKKNGGIDTEASYPYKAKNGRCKYSSSNVGAEDTGFTDIKRGDEDALKMATATVGPISVAIDASHSSFQLYKSGVYNERRCSSTRLDHGVLVVGYGTDDMKDYWLVKNSWGPSWGLEGYVMMSRNKRNQCGIATQASYPLV